jgi:hypothetical protein
VTVATANDVEARVGRPLTAQELARVTAYLDDAESEILRVAPDRLTDPDWIPAVRSVECAMVIRAARLPDDVNSVVPDLETTGYQSRPLTQGAIYLRRDERRRLGIPLVGVGRVTPDASSVDYEIAWPGYHPPGSEWWY